jgi:hypothetical protein
LTMLAAFAPAVNRQGDEASDCRTPVVAAASSAGHLGESRRPGEGSEVPGLAFDR